MISCVNSLSMTSPSPACTFVSTTIALVNELEEIEDEDDEFLVDDDFTKSAGPIISRGCGIVGSDAQNIMPFLQKVAMNRSIEFLSISGFDLNSSMDTFGILAPFFEQNPNLCCISINCTNVSNTIPNFISAIVQSKSM